MRVVIFGLAVSSAWGNGHATQWRSLIAALDAAGHEVVFYEQDTPYYRTHRDLSDLPGRARLRLYASWDDIRIDALAAVSSADAAIVTSYCPDGRAACELVLDSSARVRVFYDLDTPITLARLAAGQDVPYLPEHGLANFDLVLSFTGGRALDWLRDRLGAKRVACLYGCVDPARHRPVAREPAWSGACSYLGTWSEDRQAALDTLFLAPARRHRDPFVIGGSMYPESLAWPPNVARVDHVPPAAHPAFYCSSPLTVNVTRAPMAALGYCPSGRLFEAAACGVPVLSDRWDGIAAFFTPHEEILLAETSDDALAAIEMPRAELARIGRRARERAIAEHSGKRRAAQLVSLLGGGV
jgi:spore maturation protein CgeB